MPDGERAASLPELIRTVARVYASTLALRGRPDAWHLHPVGRFQSITVVVAYGTNPPLN